MFTLHSAPGTCALASHIALEDAGAVYNVVQVNFRAGEQRSDAYLAINPKGRVPALVTEHGILTETPAILAYIAQRFPEAALAPLHNPFAFARVQEFNLYLCSTLHIAHAHRMRGHRWADDDATIAGMKRFAPRAVALCWDQIEASMIQGPWVIGEAYSICDAYLFALAQWLEGDNVDQSRIPKVMAHRRRMAERPAVRRVLAALA
jgi:glutathione S-transferase